MSEDKKILFSCPFCGAEREERFEPVIDVDVQLYNILTDSLFIRECPECRRKFSIQGELLAISEKGHYAVLLSKESTAPSENLKNYKLRRVESVDRLKEKLLIFEALLDDRIIEMLKLAIAPEGNRNLYFTEYAEKSILFVEMSDDREILRSLKVPDSGYFSLYGKRNLIALPPGEFTSVNQTAARESILSSASLSACESADENR